MSSTHPTPRPSIDRRVPIALKVVVLVGLIAVVAAALLSIFGVYQARERIDETYAAQAEDLTRVIAAQANRHPDDLEETNALLAGIVRTHPTIRRIRLFRPGESGRPALWASSYHTDLGTDAGPEATAGSDGSEHAIVRLDGEEAVLATVPVEFPNGVTAVGIYFSIQARDEAIAGARESALVDSAVVIGVELLAVAGAMYLLVLGRVKRLGRAAAAVASGDLSVRLPEGREPPGRDELVNAAREFDHMVAAVDLRTRQQRAIAEFGRHALASIDIASLLDEAVAFVARELEADVAGIFVPSGSALALRAGVGWTAAPDATVPAGGGSQPGHTLETGTPVIFETAAAETRFSMSPLFEETGIASGASVVIPTQEGPFGVMGAHTTVARVFTKDDVILLESVANILGAAIDRSRGLEDRRHLLARLLRAQEEERSRIASDIHDDTIQKMTAVGMRLEAVRMAVEGTEAQTAVARLQDSVTLAIKRMRHLMFELAPPTLDRQGLDAALHEYLMIEAADGGFTFTLDNRLRTEPTPDTRAVAYRVAQEALVNVRKHARAKSVGVLVEPTRGGIHVRITDDGIGFAPDAEATPGHLGLPSMHERATLAGGWCRVVSTPGSGTTVEFWIPEQEPPVTYGEEAEETAS